MKIIYRGVPPEEKVFIGTCTKCGTKIEAEGKEVVQAQGGYNEILHWCTCPVCYNKIYCKSKI